MIFDPESYDGCGFEVCIEEVKPCGLMAIAIPIFFLWPYVLIMSVYVVKSFNLSKEDLQRSSSMSDKEKKGVEVILDRCLHKSSVWNGLSTSLGFIF